MRSTQNYAQRGDCCLFVDDVDGGCLVQLPSGREMNTKDMGGYDTPYIDPETRREVFYPGWAEW